jgi:cytidine deaminase
MYLNDQKTLLTIASRIARTAYAPYSNFRVGAVALFHDAPHTLFCGTNVENASSSLTICAERVAISSGVAQGFRKLATVAVACLDADGKVISGVPPCGACLQFIAEFADRTTTIRLHGKSDFKLRELLTAPFSL